MNASGTRNGSPVPSASVIIPAHDAADTLPRQLGALASQPQPREFEVIVVANRCNDATVEIARGFSGTLRLEVEEADDRASAAYARNVGADRASAPFLLFCDADDEVGIGWVTGMLDPLQTGTADFVGGCIRVDRSGLPAWMYRWRYAAFDGRCVLETPSLPYVMSASLGITAEAFAAVGGFDQRFDAAGAEEMDLAWRLLRAGYRIGEAPAAVVSYRPRHTLREGLAQSRRYR